MTPSRNAPRQRRRVGNDPGYRIPGAREAELDFHAARYGKKARATSWGVLAIPPTLGGPK